MLWNDKKEEYVKEAFEKVKLDIFALGNEISQLRTEFFEIKNSIALLNQKLIEIREKSQKLNPTENPNIQTHSAIPTHIPTHNSPLQALKYPNPYISTGNRGVPTDRQTNQQTDRFTHKNTQTKPLKENIQDARSMLEGLDALKKEIRIKFKQMTSQETSVFSAIYQLEEQFNEGVEYRIIAQKLNLSESSIRDYVQKLINKGIPIEKIKLNNKKILLKISPELKKVTSLQTILQLREL